MDVTIRILSARKIYSIKINTKTNECTNMGRRVNIKTQEFVDKLLDIIKTWKSNILGPKMIDGESYSIDIADGGEVEHFVGVNAFPDNYSDFVDLIEDNFD